MSGTNTGQTGGVGRRTVAKGAAWAVPAVAVAGAAPAHAASGITTTTTTVPPCVGTIAPVGGSYPVNVSLSGCGTANSHWDFIFSITAPGNLDSCLCGDVRPTHLRITFFDNPKRSRLWISDGFGGLPSLGAGGLDNPQSRTQNDPRLYVQKVLAIGGSALFPAEGDTVRRVSGPSPNTGFVTTPASDTVVGTILEPGESDDSLHALINPSGGGLPCSVPADTPMAYYRVECGQSATGPFTVLADQVPLNPCVPMIQATVCRPPAAGDDPYRINISVLNSCSISGSAFTVTNVQRNSDTNFPNQGSSVWAGSQSVGGGTSIQIPAGAGSGNQFWISFTTDGGVNTSRIRVPTSTVSC